MFEGSETEIMGLEKAEEGISITKEDPSLSIKELKG
jgi:hypothetical protein